MLFPQATSHGVSLVLPLSLKMIFFVGYEWITCGSASDSRVLPRLAEYIILYAAGLQAITKR